MLGASPAAQENARKTLEEGGEDAEDDAKLGLIVDAQNLPKDAVRASGMNADQVMKLIDEVTTVGSTPDDYQKPGFWEKVRKEGRDAVVKDAVADGLGLPEEAKDAGDAEDLLDIVANAQALGDDDKFQSKKFWNKVKKEGRDAALKDIAIDSLGLPPEAANAGKTKDVVEAAADGQIIGADTSTPEYWKDYEQYKNGTMPRDEFVNKHAGGAARDAAPGATGGGAQAGQAAGTGTGAAAQAQVEAARQAAVNQDAATGAGTGGAGATGGTGTGGTGSGASGASSDQQAAAGGSADQGFGAGAPGSGGVGVGSDPDGTGFGMGESQPGQEGERSGSFVRVHHNDDGSVTMTHYTILDDNSHYDHDSETYVLNEDGVWVNERGEEFHGVGGNDGFPEDGAYPTEYGDDGSYTVYDNKKDDEQSASANGGSDGGSGDGDGDGDDDGDDDNGDNGGDDGSDTAAASDGGSDDDDSGGDAGESDESTPNPANDGGDPSAGLRWAMANPDNPLAQQILKDTERQIANRRGGGVTDPAFGDYESGKGLLWAMQNPNNPVARQILKDASQAMENSGGGQVGGPDNNPENDGRTSTFTANDLKALEIILAGGGTVDPPETDSGSSGNAPPNPVTGAPPPIVGGGAAQNAAEAASKLLQNGNFQEKLKTSVGQ